MARGTSGKLQKLTLQFEPKAVKRLDRLARAKSTGVASVVRDAVNRSLPAMEAEVQNSVRPIEQTA